VPNSGNPVSKELRVFGASVRRERTGRRLTQEKLAELADLNIRTVQKIEAGDLNILVTTLLRLRAALGCKWERLLP
jgi:transcriptional regulator with XRE-family HTH domain